jgi:hypothetical protein
MPSNWGKLAWIFGVCGASALLGLGATLPSGDLGGTVALAAIIGLIPMTLVFAVILFVSRKRSAASRYRQFAKSFYSLTILALLVFIASVLVGVRINVARLGGVQEIMSNIVATMEARVGLFLNIG